MDVGGGVSAAAGRGGARLAPGVFRRGAGGDGVSWRGEGGGVGVGTGCDMGGSCTILTLFTTGFSTGVGAVWITA